MRLISVFSHVAVSLLHSPPGTLLLVNLVSEIVAVTCRYCILAHHPSPPFSFHRPAHSEMAAPAPEGPCRFFGSQGGCRYGNNCRFSHDLSPTSGTGTAPRSLGQNALSSVTPRTRSGRSGNAAPRTFCDFYWNTGQCNRGFDCTFRHQKNTNPQSGSTDVAGGIEDEDAANAALEFFTTDNLTQMAGVGLHSTQEGNPENAHNSIKQYLGRGSLNNRADMKLLISTLASVNRRNHFWVRIIPPFTPDGH